MGGERLLPGALLLLLLAAPPRAHAAGEPAAEPSPAEEPKTLPRLFEPHAKPRGLSYGGKVWVTPTADLRHDDAFEDVLELRTGVDFRVAYRFAPEARFQVEADFRYSLRRGDRVEADAWFDLGEAWLQFRKGRFTLRAGNVVLTWGRNALLSPLNRLNPIDYGKALGGTGDEATRIPVLGLRASLNLSPVAIELVWLPFFRPSRVPFYGRDFAVFRPGLMETMLPTLVPQTGAGVLDDQLAALGRRVTAAIAELDPYQRDGLQSYLAADLPEEHLWSGDVGLRISFAVPRLDIDLVGLWARLDEPQVTLHPALRRLIQQRSLGSAELTQLTNRDAEYARSDYPRSLTGGVAVSTLLGTTQLSAEAAIHSASVQYRQDLSPYTTPLLQWAVAARILAGSTFAWGLDLQHDVLLRYEDDTFLRRRHALRVSAASTLRLFRETWHLTYGTTWDVLQQELYLHLRTTMKPDDVVELSFGLQFFWGFHPDLEPSPSSFLSYKGGLIGYFRRNDYAYGNLALHF